MRRTLVGILAGAILGVTITAGVGVVRGDGEGDTGWVPDMESIYNSALTNMFDAAGEKFTDPELKEFYDRLTGEITESLQTPVPYDPGIEIPTATPTPTPTPAPTVEPTPEPTQQAGQLVALKLPTP